MRVEKDRLLSLIEFSQQFAWLRGKPAATVGGNDLFALYLNELRGLPGIRISVNVPDSEDEIWLAIERLNESNPPDVANPVLQPWVQMTQVTGQQGFKNYALSKNNAAKFGSHRTKDAAFPLAGSRSEVANYLALGATRGR